MPEKNSTSINAK